MVRLAQPNSGHLPVVGASAERLSILRVLPVTVEKDIREFNVAVDVFDRRNALYPRFNPTGLKSRTLGRRPGCWDRS